MAIVLDGVGTVNGVTLPTTGFGKVLQVVRATDTTPRSTTSTSYVDANISVTITPQKSTSAILLLWFASVLGESPATTSTVGNFRITDNSNNPVSGAQGHAIGIAGYTRATLAGATSAMALMAYATPATTSAVTFKGQFNSDSGVSQVSVIRNGLATGQMYAIEVSA